MQAQNFHDNVSFPPLFSRHFKYFCVTLLRSTFIATCPVDCSNTSNFLQTTIDFTLRNKYCHLVTLEKIQKSKLLPWRSELWWLSRLLTKKVTCTHYYAVNCKYWHTLMIYCYDCLSWANLDSKAFSYKAEVSSVYLIQNLIVSLQIKLLLFNSLLTAFVVV